MILEKILRSSLPTALAYERVSEFLLSRGYARRGDGFVRGSLWGTLSGLNPRKWSVRVSLEAASDEDHTLRFVINTFGHVMITDAERAYWDGELEATAGALRGEPLPVIPTTERDVVSSTTRMLVAATVCALMGAAGFALAAWLARRYGLPFPTGISGIGAGIGVGIVLQMWRKGELKRRASGGSDDRAN